MPNVSSLLPGSPATNGTLVLPDLAAFVVTTCLHGDRVREPVGGRGPREGGQGRCDCQRGDDGGEQSAKQQGRTERS
jgi:hypothetical protein